MSTNSLAELIKVHRNSDELDFAKVWSEGLFIFDTNVFLDLYRLPKSAREDLMTVFKSAKFNKRVWTGFQIALEFLNNRHEAISDQKNKFSKVRSLIDNAITESKASFNTLATEIGAMKLRQRHSLINPDIFLTEANFSNSIKFLNDFSIELDRLEKEQFDVNDHDDIKDFVLQIFDGRTGEPLTAKEIEEIYKEGEKRYQKDIPPGYKDKKKDGSYFYREIEYIQRFGDLLFWKEIIKKAKEGRHKYIVLITGDVKEDWWAQKRGKKLGPRKELLNEIYSSAPDLDIFHMYDTSAFLQYAKSYLGADIKDSSITEAKDLIQLNIQERTKSEAKTIDLADFISDIVTSYARDLEVRVEDSVLGLPSIKVNALTLYNALHEIFSNACHHSRNQCLIIKAKFTNDHILLRFENLRNSSLMSQLEEVSLADRTERGSGISFIKARLEHEDIQVLTHQTEKWFSIDLVFPSTLYVKS
jgi:hypothetical protein